MHITTLEPWKRANILHTTFIDHTTTEYVLARLIFHIFSKSIRLPSISVHNIVSQCSQKSPYSIYDSSSTPTNRQCRSFDGSNCSGRGPAGRKPSITTETPAINLGPLWSIHIGDTTAKIHYIQHRPKRDSLETAQPGKRMAWQRSRLMAESRSATSKVPSRHRRRGYKGPL